MAEDAADTKERLWNPHDWCWDPYNMLALASDSKGVAGAGKAAAACFAFQPQLGPAASLLLDDVNRSACRGKGPAVCQVHGCSADLAGLKEYHQRYGLIHCHLLDSFKDSSQKLPRPGVPAICGTSDKIDRVLMG